MKKTALPKKLYIVIAAALLSVAVILCGATLAGFSQSVPLGTKLNIPIGTDEKLVPNKNGGYFFIQNNTEIGQTHISLLDSNGNVLQMKTLDKLYKSACYANDNLYILLKEDQSDYGISMVTYQLDTTTLNNNKETQLATELETFTVAQNGTIYGVDYWDNTNLLAFTNVIDHDISEATKIKTFEENINSLCTLPNDQLYITLNDSNLVYFASVSQGLPYQFSSQKIESFVSKLPAQNPSNDIILDVDFNLYQIHHDTSPMFTPICNTNYTNACLLPNSTILGSPNEKAYLEVLAFDGTVKNQYAIQGQCLALATNKTATGIILKQDDALYFVTLSALIGQNDNPETSSETSSTVSVPIEEEESSKPIDPPSSSEIVPEEQPPSQLESDTFIIDRTNNTILLPPSTTFAVLRNSLNSTKDTIIVKSLNNTNISSGNLGTGYTVALQIDGKIIDKLTIIVRGDINGTGTVNAKDVLFLYSYLNKSESLSQTQLLACDLNDDGLVTTADLLLLKQQIAANS